MSRSVLPLARGQWVFQLLGSSVGVTAALLLAGSGALGLANPLYIPLGLLGLVMFGMVFVGCVRALASDGLAFTDDGFTYAGRAFRWADIAEFTRVGLIGKSHVRIVFAPGTALDWELRLAEACGKVGFYHPATHLPIKGFDTGGEPLDKILTARLDPR